MSPRHSINFGIFSALASLLLLQIGCGSEDAARGHAAAIDRTTHGLTAAHLLSVNGSYGGCTDRSGNWSLAIADAAALDNAELSVTLNDTDCVLTLTSLHTSDGILSADPSMELGTGFQTDASSFGGATVSFYANAKLSSVSFAQDFVLSIIYSDDPRLATADNDANFAVRYASATAESVPAPDYTIDMDGIAVLTDAADIVVSSTGTATLTAGNVAGQRYVVVDASGLESYAEMEAAYDGAEDAELTSTIAAEKFDLDGEDLTSTKIRTMIIVNEQHGARSYQAFEITFNPAQ
jgi:hypothetical protein